MAIAREKPEHEYVVKEYGSVEAMNDGLNSLHSEGYVLHSWMQGDKAEKTVLAVLQRRKQTILIVKES
jgi:hypothetical protein